MAIIDKFVLKQDLVTALKTDEQVEKIVIFGSFNEPFRKWNYALWDDYIDSLDPPVDETALEKVRDSLNRDHQTTLDKSKNIHGFLSDNFF